MDIRQNPAEQSNRPEPDETIGPDRSPDCAQAATLGIAAILRLFWARRQTIAGVVLAGTVLSGAYSLVVTPLYTSTTTLMPPESASSSSNLMSLLSSAGPAASAGSALLGVKTPGALFSGVLGSRTIGRRLVERFGLVSYYRVALDEDACRRLSENTSISENTRTGIISIEVTDKNAVLASHLAQAYVEELNRVLTNHSSSSARKERVFLEERLAQIEQDLNRSSGALSRFSSQNRTVDLPSQAKATVDAELKLEGELVTARSELAALNQQYAGDNVRVRAAHARVRELQEQIDRISGGIGRAATDAAGGEPLYPSIAALPALGITYADLERKIVAEETLWSTLTKQYEAAKVQEAKEIATAQVLDPAPVPERKSYPVRSRLLVTGSFLSLLAGCLFVFLNRIWETADPRDEWKRLLADIGGTLLVPVHRIAAGRSAKRILRPRVSHEPQ